MGIGYNSRRKYWRQRSGIEKPDECNDLMRFGNDYETWVANAYQWMCAQREHKCELFTHGFCFDPSDARFGGSIDRVVKFDDQWVVLEIKTCYGRSKMRDHVPVSHLCQVVGLMHAYELDVGHYVCWTPDVGFLSARITYDPLLWTDFIYPALQKFADYLKFGQEPPRMSPADKERLLWAIETYADVHPLFHL
jgi:hypothetical protein